jgi:uncharacterized repeat protein (TIGR01451 family)
MKRLTILLLLVASLATSVLLIGLMGLAVPVAANPGITLESPWMRVNYAHEWVGGNYPAGHTFTITVKDSSDAVKATAVVNSTTGGGWGDDGFDTQPEDWSPVHPDIVSGDTVLFESDDAYSNSVKVGEIGGTIDLAGNKVGGTINVPWFSATLPVECHPWGAPGGVDVKNSTAEPDGTVPYECSWNPITEWDIQPGQDIAVMYVEPDGDRVINVFQEPAPNLYVNKWAEGNGQSAPGQPVVFHLEYGNYGDAVASTITLSDTLPANTTYSSDSSGVTPVIAGNEVVWAFDPLDPGENKEFYLVLDNSASPGDILLNAVEGTTMFDPDDEDNYAEAEVEIIDEQPDLYVDKWAEPWDPAPGQTFLYKINYGNNGPVASGPVVLTDILPSGVTIDSWRSREGYSLWQEVSAGGNFILTAPSIPGNWGDTIELRVLLDGSVNPGTTLVNEVSIDTLVDSDLDNNQSETEHEVGDPRWNGSIYKNFGWGVLAPEGAVGYNLNIYNDGNMATGMTVTDMMPFGTSFDEAWSELNGEWVSFPPDNIDGRMLTWDLGTFEPAQNQNISLRLKLDDVQAGQTIVNCASVAISDDDQRPGDDTACAEEMIHEPGANLRVTKNHWWEGEDRIHFSIRVENNGTTLLTDVEIVDTYPQDTQFNGEWWNDYWREITFSEDVAQRKLVWTVEELYSGDSFNIDFILNVDSSIVGDQGLAFTNLVEAPIADDVYPANNSYEDTAYTGPNLYVKKWLKTEFPSPGDEVLFVVEFGNASQGTWGTNGDTSLVDDLGDGMTFIKATDPDDPARYWLPKLMPDGNLLWEWGNMNSDSRWQFEMTVKIDDDVDPRSMLTNTIEVSSSDQEDIDPVAENNIAMVTFRAGQLIYLPVIQKN